MNKGKKHKKYGEATNLVHGGIERSPHGETAEALYLTQGYIYQSAQSAQRRFNNEEQGYIYSRYANPTVCMFEKRIAKQEGAEAACATASGMAAVFASLFCQLEKGDHVIAPRALFGSCRYIIETLLPKFGIATTLINGTNMKEWQQAIKKNTKVFFIETPTNPKLDILDIKKIATLAKKHNICFIVDNVFATPILQKPLQLGADVVVYSATKHIDGQGRCLGGVILGKQKWIDEKLFDFYRHTGPSLSPFNAWVLLKGLETLSLRVKQASQNAKDVAKFLQSHKKIANVFYPHLPNHPQYELAKKQMRGGSTMIAFDIKGSLQEAFCFENNLELIKISNNLGDAKSLITHPATTTHKNLSNDEKQTLKISEKTLRLSVGLETCQDLIDDIEQSLAKI